MVESLRGLLRRRRRRIRLAHEVQPPSPRRQFLVRGSQVGLILVTTLFAFPLQVRFDPPEVLEGTIAPEEVIAPFTFDVPKSGPELERERARAAESILPVFAVSDRQAEINRTVAELDRVRRSPLELATHLRERGVMLGSPTRRALAAPDTGAVLVRELGRLLTRAQTAGLVADEDQSVLNRHQRIRLEAPTGSRTVSTYEVFDRGKLGQEAADRGNEVFGPSGAAALADLAIVFSLPNASYDHQATERARAAARASVVGIRSSVQKGERIVDAHERITPENVVVLQALEAAMTDRTAAGGVRSWLFPMLGRAILVGSMLVLMAVALRVSRPGLWASLNMMNLLTAVLLLTLGVAAVIARTPMLHPYLTPIPLAAILVTLLVDDLVGMMVVAWLAALVGTVTGWGMSVTLVGFVGGIAAIYSVRDVTHRLEVYRSMLLVALAMIAAVAGVMLVGPIVPWAALWQEIVWAVGNAVLCTAAAVLILPVFEKIFDRVTNISLLELSDLNRPIFKRMMVEANGTYHHSLVIGSLAEAAAEAIGANPLLARVGAYYHDIGKIAKSTYFGENMRKGSRNPHERLTPTMSSLILESHVREGLELAREIGLPGQVAAFIPEHQGTTLMQYFYNKALELDPEVEERDYRYPGPRPRTKETAIVMLGDAAEATVRSLDEQSPQRIRAVLDRIFELRTSDGQLDECGVTVSDLARIRDAFTHVLSGVFHGRVKYQWQKDGGEEQLGAASAERVFHPELETGLGTETLPGSRSYAAVSQAPDKTPEG